MVDKRRAALTHEMIDALVFLNKNSFFLGLTKECSSNPILHLILEIDGLSDSEELHEDLEQIQSVDVDKILLDESESE